MSTGDGKRGHDAERVVEKEHLSFSKNYLRTFPIIQDAERVVEQARKSSEDAQAAGYAQFEKVWAGQLLVRKRLDPISRDVYDGHDHDHDHE